MIEHVGHGSLQGVRDIIRWTRGYLLMYHHGEACGWVVGGWRVDGNTGRGGEVELEGRGSGLTISYFFVIS